MKNTTLLPMLFAGFLVFTLGSCRDSGPATVLEQHEASYPDIRKKYVYQSLIRMANINQDPNFEKLIKDVRKIVLFMPPSEDSTYQIKSVRTGLEADGYELLVEGRTADQTKMSLWVKENGARSHYIALMDSAEGEDMILEVDGQINIEYLMALEVADQDALKGLIEGGF
jgi:hypothetical protein